MSKKTEEIGAYNVRGAAKYIGVSAPTLLKLIHDTKEIPHKRVGKRVIIPKAALDTWLEAA
jgi:excisionase family DNA binding protein